MTFPNILGVDIKYIQKEKFLIYFSYNLAVTIATSSDFQWKKCNPVAESSQPLQLEKSIWNIYDDPKDMLCNVSEAFFDILKTFFVIETFTFVIQKYWKKWKKWHINDCKTDKNDFFKKSFWHVAIDLFLYLVLNFELFVFSRSWRKLRSRIHDIVVEIKTILHYRCGLQFNP